MDSLYDGLTGALSYAGDALEKPGRAVRGVLAGKPREALAAVPFSDSMGLTDPKQRTTGRDLLDHYNLTTKGGDSWGGHVAGFAADMATDPLNAVAGVGAFRAAPTVARGLKAGAKAFTGLDLIDHIGGAASSISRGAKSLASSEHGALSFGSFGAGRKSAKVATPPAGVDVPDLGDFYRPAKNVQMEMRQLAEAPHGTPPPEWMETPWIRAHMIGKADHVPVHNVNPYVWSLDGNQPNVIAHYQTGPGDVELNMGMKAAEGGPSIWDDKGAMRQLIERNRASGWHASAHPDAIIDHEVGHALHHRSLGKEFFTPEMREPVFDPHFIQANLSEYATTNPKEFVAEMYSALRGGRDFRRTDPGIRDYFTDMAGTKMLDHLSNQGLLKGLGLGVMGGAGLGAAYAGQPTASAN